ncbi:MAG: helicase [Alphaproteobacteria bacterium]|nr:helicase [Alphaproteobacteria bacterium]
MFDGQTGSLRAVLGPTNTGKTHFAIERILAHPSGMIGLPLRLLAREVYQRMAAQVGADKVALVTGEERLVPPRPRYWVATVEAMPLDFAVDCLAIDEIQTAVDFDRGHVFTDRLLSARGRMETLLLGAATMVPIVRKLLPGVEIVHRPRLSTLTWASSKKITRQPARTAIVAFSAAEVYAIAELLRRERGGAAVVMGALSPRTRNAQVDLFENGDVDFLVATDAIGMGLNLGLNHVAFASETKFDGYQTRPLTPAEFGQIAGRAGRHTTNGTFGTTGLADAFDAELIERIEGHDFEPVKMLQWRNPDLDFDSLKDLRGSLDRVPDRPGLTRAPTAIDQRTLEALAQSELSAFADSAERVRLMWECCQIPDYRDISPAQHTHLVSRIFRELSQRGKLDTDWIAEQVRFCDNTEGDIDTLSHRIRQTRTWTFVANRRAWLEDPVLWRERTRSIEDRLSDALHEKLTQRFVDRRTSVLIRHLRDRRMVSPEITDRGEISVEGHLIGTIEGFRFTLARTEGEVDAKGLRAAAASAVAPEIRNRAARLANAPNEEIILSTDGYLRWKGEVVAEIVEGDDILSPRVLVLADESLTGAELERVQERLGLWLRHLINTQLDQIATLKNPSDLEGTARGIAFQLAEHLGILPRQVVAGDVKGLDQDVRGKMRKLGIKFGAYHIYVPMSLKPAPRELALILHALKNGGVRQPGVSELPPIILSGRTSFETDPEVAPRLYEIAGFKLAGKRAVRVDILERLADLIRPLIALNPETAQGEVPPGAAPGNGFRVTVEMTSLLGCAGEDFASILKSLGYRLQRVALPPEPAEPGPELTEAEADQAGLMALDGAAPEEVGAAAAEPSEEKTDAQADQADLATLDGADETAIAAAVATAPAADGAIAAETEGESAGTLPAEPRFDEIWFPGGRSGDRHKGDRRPQRGHGAEPDRPGDQQQSRPPRAERRGPPRGERKDESRATDGRNGADRREGGRRPKPEQHADKRADTPRRPEGSRERPPREERPIDPDSPFAALAVLKERQKK